MRKARKLLVDFLVLWIKIIKAQGGSEIAA